MTVNPNGYVCIADGGTPRIITGYAKEVISGGNFCGASGAAGVVSSGTDSFATTDLQFFVTTGSMNFVGIALNTAASGAPVSVATAGLFLVPVSGATNVLAGTKVGCSNLSDVIWIGSEPGNVQSGMFTIGRALTTGSHGNYVVLSLGAA
jgi:predicted RecA/RadA family phage recombinase